MAVRKIEFTVSSDGITPSVKQFAGVQGDHKATEVVFNIAPELYQSLTAQATNGAKLIYRFDGYDGEGGFKPSDTFEFTETQVSYLLEEWLTRFGGIIKVVLVISALKDDLTQMELFNFPALLQLKNSPEGVEIDGINRESMSTLAQVAKDSANTAVNAKHIAVEAQEKTELARAALENGTVWVFDGGDASGNVDLDGDGTPDMNTADIKFMVDNEMSDDSENAVKNKVIKAYVDKLFKVAKLEAHPIGSLYYSFDKTEPSVLFGGTWERIKDRFILAAGDTYTVGETGGAATHLLTVEEMPSHDHYDGTNPDIIVGAVEGAVSAIVFSNPTMEGARPTTATGGNQPHNNMPPYEVAYCWKRIA
jgi:hypothetical protein